MKFKIKFLQEMKFKIQICKQERCGAVKKQDKTIIYKMKV